MEFFKQFATYWKEAPFDSFLFWVIPVGTVLLVWVLTIIGLKLFKRKQLRTVFMVKRAWIVSALIVACILIGVICYCWTANVFAKHPYQLSLLLALIIAMLIPVLCLAGLRKFYSSEGLKEITEQPKTVHRLDTTIPFLKRAFAKNKTAYLIPLLGFLLLLLYFNKGTNLISIVFDNSGSMTRTSAVGALAETFDKLEDNNEIVFSTLEGYHENDAFRVSMEDVMKVRNSHELKAGNVIAFQNPAEAGGNLARIADDCIGSPICEAIWKTYLTIAETKQSQTYVNKLMVVITDGEDNLLESSLASGKFFFDNDGFSEYFTPENVFIIDYSEGKSNPFMMRCSNAGCDVYPAANSKQAYLDGLDNALQAFKNNRYLIYWTVLIFAVFTLIGLFIPPKKIV